eukprot:SAG31_NODE_23992_length_491_cov_1.280612_1_plen_51_part_10
MHRFQTAGQNIRLSMKISSPSQLRPMREEEEEEANEKKEKKKKKKKEKRKR